MHAQGAPTCGTSLGTRPADDTSLTSTLRHHAYLGLAQRLHDGAFYGAHEKELLTGILASHQNQHAIAIRLLEPLARREWPGQSYVRFAAQAALAQSYEKSFQYGRAASEYRSMVLDSTVLSDNEVRGSADSRQVMELLDGAAAQRVVAPARFAILSHGNKLGLKEVTVRSGSTSVPWIFDTGASISTITETFARRIGAQLSAKAAATQGIGGHTVPLRVALIPELRIAAAVVKNVAVLVVPDSTLFISQLDYQINAILGYPVIAALGEVTLHHDGRIDVRRSGSAALAQDANLYMEGSTPLLAAKVDGRTDLYQFDSGANQSFLTQRFCATHSLAGRGATASNYGMAGAGGSRALPSYIVPTLHVEIGGASSQLANVHVLTGLIGTELDLAFGNLGQDLVGPFKSYSLDFRRMRFTLER
ncbi:MAG: retropepsin-like aspartic protease [Gemmatimonadaceae bacterium]